MLLTLTVLQSKLCMRRWTPHTLEQLKQAQQAAAKADDSQLHVHVLPNAGHWLHVDNPHGLLDMMLPSFIDPKQ